MNNKHLTSLFALCSLLIFPFVANAYSNWMPAAVQIVPINDEPCNAIGLPVNPSCSLQSFTTVSATATQGLPVPACGAFNGSDIWFYFIAPLSGSIEMQSVAGTMTDGMAAAYTGTCNGLTEIKCDDDGGPGFMPQLNLSGLIPGDTVYLRFDSYPNSGNGSFSLCIVDVCANIAPPANDQPCNAQVIQLGVYTQGWISKCATNSNEPLPPACWTNGSINTVWYSITASSASMHIRCNPSSLNDPQIALYAGSCGTTLTEIGCNNDGAPCGFFSPYSDFIFTGLISGTTYFIVVDGVLDSVGTFNIIAVDGSQPLPPIPGQDCGSFQPVCSQVFTVGNPGFTGVGNICDFDGSGANCLDGGERASAWYEFATSGIGVLEFNIIANDWPGAPSTVATDYDFAIWKTQGTGAVTCAAISSGAVPLRCNYSFLGVTGLYGPTAGVSPPAYPGFGGAYQEQIAVVGGEKYTLVVSNYLNNKSGFSINFSGASPIVYGIGSDSTVYWSGAVDTDWFKSANWGGCTVPSCSTNAVVGGGITRQPIINATASCKKLTVNPGATLTLTAAAILTLCGDYLNNGSLNAAAGSAVKINNGSVIQELSGNMASPHSFGNIEISKSGGTVHLNQNVDLKGNLNIMSATSMFDVNTQTVKIAGNFTSSGSYAMSAGGLLEFNGTTAQQYTHASSLGNVRMNNKGTGLNLLSNITLNNTSALTLDSGKIITNTFEVRINNRASNAVSSGNSQSYVQGNLKRSINPLGSYDFAVGHSTKGYQRTTINFAYPAFPTTIDNLRVSFATHPALPGGLGAMDCGVTFSSNALDNGFWQFTPDANPLSGRFDLTLYNTNYSNAFSGFTIMSDAGSGWTLGSGTCVPSPVTAVKRLGMTGVYKFATAQSTGTPLPVQWLYINAEANEKSITVNWATASEENNDGFEVLKSTDGIGFEKIGWVKGHGNSNVINLYSFDDTDAKPGIDTYYKLRQVDFNGVYDESKVVSAQLAIRNLSIVPNLVSAEAVIRYYANSDDLQLYIADISGVMIKNLQNGMAKKGSHTHLLDSKKLLLSSGYYVLVLIDNDKVSRVPFYVIQ